MSNNINLAYSILNPREDHPLLKGMYEAVFDDTKTKFFAFTYLPIDSESYADLECNLNKFSWCSMNVDDEKTKTYNNDNSYQLKSTKQCIEENIITHYSVTFIGMLYEGEWYISKTLSYFGDIIDEPTAKKILKFHGHKFDWWSSPCFVPNKPHVFDEFSREIEDEEFQMLPSIVAEYLKNKKGKINKAFKTYINEEVCLPFSRKLKISLPEKYHYFHHIFNEEFDLVHPAHKQFVMMITPFADFNKKNFIEYFVYKLLEEKIYLWTFPRKNILEIEYEYRETAIKQLSAISNWDHIGFINSSRTLDDENFWGNYVFKTNDKGFEFLLEIPFQFYRTPHQ